MSIRSTWRGYAPSPCRAALGMALALLLVGESGPMIRGAAAGFVRRWLLALLALAWLVVQAGAVAHAEGEAVTVTPGAAAQQDQFVFDGKGFRPGDLVDVTFTAPDGREFPLYVNGVKASLLVHPDGGFRLVAQPSVVFVGAPFGAWRASFCAGAACQVVSFEVVPPP